MRNLKMYFCLSNWIILFPDTEWVSSRIRRKERNRILEVSRVHVRRYLGGSFGDTACSETDPTLSTKRDGGGLQIQGPPLGETFPRGAKEHEFRRSDGKQPGLLFDEKSKEKKSRTLARWLRQDAAAFSA